MLTAVVLLVFVVAVYAYTNFNKQEKEIKTLKKEFGQILDIVEPVVSSQNKKKAPPPPQEEEEQGYQNQQFQPPQNAIAPPQMSNPIHNQMMHNNQMNRAPPYGATPRPNENREQPPLNPSAAGSVTIPGGGGTPGVSLEQLAGGNHQYAGLF